jgi:hypothetical protein
MDSETGSSGKGYLVLVECPNRRYDVATRVLCPPFGRKRGAYRKVF